MNHHFNIHICSIVVICMRNFSHRLRYMNTWSPVRHAIWRFRRYSFAGGSTSLGQVLKIHSIAPLLVLSVCFLSVHADKIFQPLAPNKCCHTTPTIRDSLSEMVNLNQLLCVAFGIDVYHSNIKVTKTLKNNQIL